MEITPKDNTERKQGLYAMNIIVGFLKDKTIPSKYCWRVADEISKYETYSDIPDNCPYLERGSFQEAMDTFLDMMVAALKNETRFSCPKKSRRLALICMEFMARQINDEDVFYSWLMCGVPDGDIQYGNFDLDQIAEDDEVMLDDEGFYGIANCFLARMKAAHISGGLWCGNVCTIAGDGEEDEE